MGGNPEDTVTEAAYDAMVGGDWGKALVMLETYLRGNNRVTHEDREKCAERRLRHAYLEEPIGKTADRVVAKWRDGAYGGRRKSVLEDIEEECDSHFIYKWNAQLYLWLSEHCNAYIDHYGDAPVETHGELLWEDMASRAMYRDVLECLKEIHGIDVEEDVPPKEHTIECDRCGDWKQGTGDVCDECKEAP